jgi:hypothetical protein
MTIVTRGPLFPERPVKVSLDARSALARGMDLSSWIGLI